MLDGRRGLAVPFSWQLPCSSRSSPPGEEDGGGDLDRLTAAHACGGRPYRGFSTSFSSVPFSTAARLKSIGWYSLVLPMILKRYRLLGKSKKQKGIAR
jgi:hypothetical protein